MLRQALEAAKEMGAAEVQADCERLLIASLAGHDALHR
jgi:hypothetical protein